MAHIEGHRYVRSYRVSGYVQRWALYETQHGKARRVGTARTALAYLTFLRITGDLLVRCLRHEAPAA